jgi:YHS domain-containing protein
VIAPWCLKEEFMLTSRLTFAATALLVTFAACDKKEQPSARPEPAPAASDVAPIPPPAPAAAQPARGALTVVDPSQVCMVNNQFMGSPQIPVTVEGKTYYGCCEMCKGRLANDPSSRTAVDPVSQRTVDKAAAVIGKTETGAALYFENERNLLAYSAPQAPSAGDELP